MPSTGCFPPSTHQAAAWTAGSSDRQYQKERRSARSPGPRPARANGWSSDRGQARSGISPSKSARPRSAAIMIGRLGMRSTHAPANNPSTNAGSISQTPIIASSIGEASSTRIAANGIAVREIRNAKFGNGLRGPEMPEIAPLPDAAAPASPHSSRRPGMRRQRFVHVGLPGSAINDDGVAANPVGLAATWLYRIRSFCDYARARTLAMLSDLKSVPVDRVNGTASDNSRSCSGSGI